MRSTQRPSPQGFGSKKQQQRSPKRADDSGHSSAHASILGVLSEGEVEGLVGDAQGIYFDETPAENADGSQNFNDFSWDFRSGTQVQTPMAGYGDFVASETPINAEVSHNLPVTRTVNNPNLDVINVRLGFQLQVFKDNGDVEGNELDYSISIRQGSGAFVERHRQTLREKYSSLTELEFDFPVDNQGGTVRSFQVRVTRHSPEAEDQTADQKLMRWQSYSERTLTKLSYPHSAMIGLNFDADQFSEIPELSFLIANSWSESQNSQQCSCVYHRPRLELQRSLGWHFYHAPQRLYGPCLDSLGFDGKRALWAGAIYQCGGPRSLFHVCP